jgi:3-deoxy-manno-octulosonate cytidylyltransferase (CMP-KDO synthetase)
LKIGIVIPARLESERLPNKVLRKFLGISMIEHVWRRAVLAAPNLPIVIATDSLKIAKTCESFGAKTIVTKKPHSTGTSRVGEISLKLNWDYYIVLQADEILIEPRILKSLIRKLQRRKFIDFINVVSSLLHESELKNINIVKCLIRPNGSIISLFRESGLTCNISTQIKLTKKVSGIFVISHSCLQKLSSRKRCEISSAESIEQMKLIEQGIEVDSLICDYKFHSVNTNTEAVSALRILQTNTVQKRIMKEYM